jgi:peptidoglycan-associated lipoprotein
MHRLRLVALVAAAAALVAGCGSDPKPEPRIASAATTGSDANHAAPQRRDTTTPTSGSVHIDDKILEACGSIPAAHFSFDSARVQPDAASALDALVKCFTSGPLAGRNMLLTGHTDPRGETEYNMGLGQRRAGSVSAYLAGRGLSRAQVSTTSRGAEDATGTDQQGWAQDRKVDVSLVE